MTDVAYWNPNVHYHPDVLAAVPAGCGSALDVGCGDGLLVRRLAPLARHVTGVDHSPEMVAVAERRNADLRNVDFLSGDVLAARDALPEGTYDFVSMVAVAHHIGFARAVREAADLLAPGGRLAIIGLANPGSLLDLLPGLAAVAAARFHGRRHGGKESAAGMPVADPDLTWREVRREARRLLPGSRFRRRLLWRYTLVWEKPR